MVQSQVVHVMKLNDSFTEDNLTYEFNVFGAVKCCKIFRHFASIHFEDSTDAFRAL
jgi:hypothetical protein